jgi:membrane-anchored mycosin MYCP
MTIRRRVRSAAVVAGTAAVVTALAVSPAHADDSSYVKYYTVTTSYQGSAENLSEIATRFLGSQSRSVEVYNLNVGREQADGKALSDATRLDAGWEIVLPWDAVGAGVQYGTLPTSLPTTTPTSGTSKSGTSGTPAQPGGTTKARPGASTTAQPGGSTTGKPAVQPSSGSPAADPAGSGCATGTPAGKIPDWARQTVDASTAWTHSKGTGELVAVVDSGVDGSLTQLAGHVSVGADVVSGNGRGDVDCLGTGTGMAAIIAARPGTNGALAGIAPNSTIMPVRVVTTSAQAQADDEATAISVATASGATVIALGSYVDTSNAKVVAAIKQAVGHDVVVVCAAPAPTAPVSADTTLPSHGVLRVGGVGEDGQPTSSYKPGTVDVQAPGSRVSTLGLTGTGTVVATGTQYAVAFVAGEAALIRAAYPSLPAAGVTDRVEQTAKTPSGASGGAKLMDPEVALTAALAAAELGGPGSSGVSSVTSGSGRVILLALIGLVLLIALVLLVSRVRRLLRADGDAAAYAEDESAAAPPWPVPPETSTAK